jgi:hypothetical protein
VPYNEKIAIDCFFLVGFSISGVGNADCSVAAKLFNSGQVNKEGIDAIE